MKKRGFKIVIPMISLLFFIFLIATINVMFMPGNIKITQSKNNLINLENSKIKSNFLYKVENEKYKDNDLETSNKIDISIKLFGILPVRKMTLCLLPEVKVIPGGQPIGVKLFTDGILVVGFSDVETATGKKQSPAASAGIEIGDRIIDINGIKLNSSEDLSNIIGKFGEKELNINLNRKGQLKTVKVTPTKVKNSDQYKIGLWVRDSTAGVGTLTFYDPSTGRFGALGHPINDVDTGLQLPVRDGKIYNAKIIAVEQGTRGKPGELRGMFSEEDVLGILEKNTMSGIYGKLTTGASNGIYNKAIPIARQSEIKEGPAKILTSVEGADVKAYDIYIERLTEQSRPNPKSMIIRITDKELLSKTGGIVQGMSGSPIIQDGKLIGAVTHVFVNRPDMGYGIYIEWMLNECGVEI
ncbi:stage IV sporulation protein B [Fervidicella metallireducens AeB]|uniref:Stage IV sporulation protein B n=1 Tax=Fervidicella metallireducens AeB TaxID=1403537 RepID=A0A017RYG0_9CLOT|nr:SpoIVB peptidase [Fervidicella metallireducens]EYE89707.1 stage IV sporulation protein B [Fervidicella metallireducens AeB]